MSYKEKYMKKTIKIDYEPPETPQESVKVQKNE